MNKEGETGCFIRTKTRIKPYHVLLRHAVVRPIVAPDHFHLPVLRLLLFLGQRLHSPVGNKTRQDKTSTGQNAAARIQTIDSVMETSYATPPRYKHRVFVIYHIMAEMRNQTRRLTAVPTNTFLFCFAQAARFKPDEPRSPQPNPTQPQP